MNIAKLVALYGLLTIIVFGGVVLAAEVKKETEEFQTDVRKMLDIIINSLYTNRNIFLRELISNASDALDKVRFAYLTKPLHPKNAAGEEPSMEIRIWVDKASRTLMLKDGGIGMSREDMRNNLGSLGSSGTKAFMESMGDGNADMNLIGQFGVGFYSAFLVADRVSVASVRDGEATQYVWESTADGQFSTFEDPRGNTLGRGTEVTLHLKDDADEFLEESKLKEIASRYSEFITFPIFVRETKTEKVEKEADADEAEAKEGDEAEVKEEKTKEYEEVEHHTWVQVNEQKPIWTRKASDLTEADYQGFYEAISKDKEAPLLYNHFVAEGEVDFKSILYIPSKAPFQMFDATGNAAANIKLYVRRVFITDEFKDMLPRYLSFLKGVVDSDDLPLNVSRELLQESRILKVIKKKLIRKALAMIKDLADEDAAKLDEWHEANDAKPEDDREDQPTQKYNKFWTEYGKALRLGLIEDTANRARITKLLRYPSTRNTDGFVSLESYVDRMIDGQKDIYYVIGPSETPEKLMSKPFLQRAVALGVEVLLMTDAIDEYVVGHLTEFASKKLVNLAKDDVRLPGEEGEEKKLERAKEANKDFTDWFKGVLGDRVEKVTLSNRLTDSPAIVVSSKYGLTANMYNIMKGTPLSEQHSHGQEAKRVLELNLRNPIVHKLRALARADSDDANAHATAVLLFETASFDGGFPLDDVSNFVGRMQKSMGASLGVESTELLPEEEYAAEPEVEEDDSEVR